MSDEIINRLKEFDRENFMYVIFFIILVLSYIANIIEKEYFVKRSEENKIKYYCLQIFIFTIVVLINIYYVFNSYEDVVSLSLNDNMKTKNYAYLNLVASLAALVAGGILLYIAITDKEIDAEISL